MRLLSDRLIKEEADSSAISEKGVVDDQAARQHVIIHSFH
jgi:hypothetical protein